MFVPSDWTIGPWYERAQHGGPPAALLVRALEACESAVPMQLVRINIELLRPVPLEPLVVVVEQPSPPAQGRRAPESRPRRVQRLKAALYADNQPVATAFGLRVRSLDVQLPPNLPPAMRLPDLDSLPVDPTTFGGFHAANEFRFVQGSFEEPGPGIAWIRLKHPVIDGEQASGAMRAVAAADFANGVGAVLDLNEYFFVNPDLSIHLHRQPRGEWIGLESLAHVDGAGAGITDTKLYDRDGEIGRAVQCLVVERRA